MKAKPRRSGWISLIAGLIVFMAAMLVPGFATMVGRVIANLWVTVMSAVAGILGGFLGA